jgi:hypothetical protein|tara:strand:+ start:210 stop:374 length:165 start_codon:yes stop_codon:yes gene_type:complete
MGGGHSASSTFSIIVFLFIILRPPTVRSVPVVELQSEKKKKKFDKARRSEIDDY